ncbi:hypothetical protein FOA52_001286 [Chlamydomonas sp. UWO 241]|nr:hypothetical protein FOA52_001286 [Chlamydomonas sp. UWO 241]
MSPRRDSGADAVPQEGLEGALKSNIYSVKVLGEGAFGIVDLVVVERPQGDNLLCVRKKLLKKTATNSSDPDQEIEFMEACEGLFLFIIEEIPFGGG